MNENQALALIFERLGTTGKPVNIGFDEVQEWQAGVLEALVNAKLLVSDIQASSLECKGCENACIMPVLLSEDFARAFIVCDHPDKQSHMGRISVSLTRLQQWQVNVKQVAALVSGLLGFDSQPTYQKEPANYKLGMLKGSKGRRWVFLSVQPLELVINQQSIPLADVIYMENGQLVIDQLRVDDLANSTLSSTAKPYTPDTSQQELRKLATQAMYKDWQDEYRRLKRLHPNKSGEWYASQISKQPMAKGRDANTIKKNMK